MTKIIQSPSYLTVTIGNDGKKIIASVKPETAWGIHKDAIVVETNVAAPAVVRIATDVDVHRRQ